MDEGRGGVLSKDYGCYAGARIDAVSHSGCGSCCPRLTGGPLSPLRQARAGIAGIRRPR